MDDRYGEALKALQRAVAEEDPLWEELNRLGPSSATPVEAQVTSERWMAKREETMRCMKALQAIHIELDVARRSPSM